MPNIYELKNEFITLWSILEDGLADDETLAGAFETATDDLKDKLENCAKYIKNQTAIIKGLKEEEERLKEKRQAKENAVDRLKKLMESAMTTAGEKKLECGTFLVYIQKNPESVKLDTEDASSIPAEFFKARTLKEVDKTKIKNAIESGADLKGIAHIEQSESIRIK